MTCRILSCRVFPSMRTIVASSGCLISWTPKPGARQAEASKRPITARGIQQQCGALLVGMVGTDEISG